MHMSFSLGDIPRKHIPKLANILQFRPKENHQDQEQRVKTTVKTLPSKLKGPGRLIRLLLHPRIDACEWHKGLNRCVTDVILHYIQIEIGVRLNSLISHSELLPPEHFDRISRLRELHALWLGPEEFEKTFLIPTQNVPWKYQVNKCDACILSCIAGNMQTLLDLRCVVSSRATSKFVAKHGIPRLQIWVDAWIETLATHVRNVTGLPVPLDFQVEKNDHQAVELKHLRAKIQSLRKKRFHSAGPHRAMAHNVDDAASPTKAGDGDDRICEDKGEEIVSTKQARRKDVGDIDEDGTDRELASVDAFAALKSSEYLPFMLDARTQYENPNITDAADPTSSFQTAIRDNASSNRVPQERDVYVPPRQGWKKETPAFPPSAARSHHPTATSRRESWESVIFDSNFVESGIMHQSPYASRQPHLRPGRPASSRYASAQPQLASRRPTVLNGRAHPSPADAYINDLPSFTDYDSAAKGKQPIPSSKAHNPPRHTRPAPKGQGVVGHESHAAQDFHHIYDDLAQNLGNRHGKNPSKASTSNHLASDLDISQESRSAMVPEGLKTPKRRDHGGGDDDATKKHRPSDRHDGDTRGKKATVPGEKKHGEGHRGRHHQQPEAHRDAKKHREKGDGDDDRKAHHKADHKTEPKPLERRTSNSVRRRDERANPRPDSHAPPPTAAPEKNHNRDPPASKKDLASNTTTWSAEYGSLLRAKDDCRWFYQPGRT